MPLMSRTHHALGRRTGAQALLVGVLAIACTTPDPREILEPASRRAAAGSASVPSAEGGERGPDESDAGSLGMARLAEGTDAAMGAQGASSPGTPEGLVRCERSPVVPGDFTREALRRAVAECAAFHYCEFANSALWLQHAVAWYADSPKQGERRAHARRAFGDAMLRWSHLELYQFGPAASPAPAAGRDVYQGLSYRDRIYAWPTVSRCRVEEQLLSRNYATDGFARIPISGRGLYALEYLLFHEGIDTACAEDSEAAMRWDELSAEQLREAKAAYALAVAADVVGLARELASTWSAPGEEGFRDRFVSGSGYPDEQEAMNVLAWSFAYIDKEAKDWKIGVPAGYTLNAPVTEPETPYALLGREALGQNLEGFRSLLEGCAADGSGLGVDDWLAEAGHGALARDLLDAQSAAQQALDGLPRLHEAAPAELEASYQALRSLSSLLKAELLGPGSPLNLKLPASIEGDTD